MRTSNKNAPLEAVTSAGAIKINQANNNTELKSGQVPEEILKEVTEMHKRYREIYADDYRVAGIDGSHGVQLSSEAFWGTFDEYEVERRDSREYPFEMFTEYNGVRVFAVVSEGEYYAVLLEI